MIRPAAFCGVVGFKPTQGALPIAGALTFSHTLDQPGIFTRTAREAAWLFGILTEDGPIATECRFPPRLAAVRTPVWDQASEAAKDKFQQDLEALRRAGASVEEKELPEVFALAQGVISTIMSVEAAFNLEELAATKATFLSATLRDFIADGNRTGAPFYLKALSLRAAMQEGLERFLAGYDAIVTPPATGEAPATLEQTGNPAFCSIWSICGVPAITIPTGFGPQGLPMGLQIVAGRRRDDLALKAACWCEGKFDFPAWRKSP
jgi:Asp-tRNA(Asn)/Glu-tRNA(Gln) amidotransferase A subunit family amidase